ncbi:hypothetical protein KDW_26760 [Dictyobacter vulcani]|uniref:YD repeat-containing protein n=2 Tax=Dictyobacter vulcani TaxID=2607529 RepID=A0A5J4KGB0_9CHLR|nr:hypothetical protein KDW_26760 [Dictyobacter vulcani]
MPSAYAATATTASAPAPIVSDPIVNGVDKARQLLLKLASAYRAPKMAPKVVHNSTLKPLVAGASYNGLGDLPFYTYVGQRHLTDQVSMKVNVANGNLLVNTAELGIKGTGINLAVGSTYNSAENQSNLLDAGDAWYFNTGRGVTLDLSNLANGISLHGPSDTTGFFKATGSGTFSDDIGLKASIASTGSGTYTVTFRQSGEQWGFNSNGSRLIDCDKNGNCLNFQYNGQGDLTSITDTQNRQVTFVQGSDSANDLHQVTSYTVSTTDGTSKTLKRVYTGFRLTSLINADQKTTTLSYYSDGHLKTITDPLLHTTTFAYGTDGKLATITDAKSKTVQFAYKASNDSACSGLGSTAQPCTVVTDQNGHTTTYSYNPSLEVTTTKDALGHTRAQAFDATSYNVTSATDGLSSTTNFTYGDPSHSDNLTATKDATGAGSTFTYTALIRPTIPIRRPMLRIIAPITATIPTATCSRRRIIARAKGSTTPTIPMMARSSSSRTPTAT